MAKDEKTDTEELVCSVPVAGAMAKLGKTASYRAAQTGDIPTIRVGGRVLVPLKIWRAKLNGEAQ
jgi:hypothetical protein